MTTPMKQTAAAPERATDKEKPQLESVGYAAVQKGIEQRGKVLTHAYIFGVTSGPYVCELMNKTINDANRLLRRMERSGLLKIVDEIDYPKIYLMTQKGVDFALSVGPEWLTEVPSPQLRRSARTLKHDVIMAHGALRCLDSYSDFLAAWEEQDAEIQGADLAPGQKWGSDDIRIRPGRMLKKMKAQRPDFEIYAPGNPFWAVEYQRESQDLERVRIRLWSYAERLHSNDDWLSSIIISSTRPGVLDTYEEQAAKIYDHSFVKEQRAWVSLGSTKDHPNGLNDHELQRQDLSAIHRVYFNSKLQKNRRVRLF